jgi:hypothetical protein
MIQCIWKRTDFYPVPGLPSARPAEMNSFIVWAVLRLVLKPLLVPLKLWATFVALQYMPAWALFLVVTTATENRLPRSSRADPWRLRNAEALGEDPDADLVNEGDALLSLGENEIGGLEEQAVHELLAGTRRV